MNFEQYLKNTIDSLTDEEYNMLDEAIISKWVIRHGERVKKYKSTKPGFKIQINRKTGMPKEVVYSDKERANRLKGAAKAKRTRQLKKHSEGERLKSLRVRRKFGIVKGTNLEDNKADDGVSNTKYKVKSSGSKRKTNNKPVSNNKPETDKSLYPNMLKEQYSPSITLLNEFIWDYALLKEHSHNNDWLLSLITLYKDKQLETDNEIIKLTANDLNEITTSLLNNKRFLSEAKLSYNQLSIEDKALFNMIIDNNLRILMK